jgi:hypothetical protein
MCQWISVIVMGIGSLSWEWACYDSEFGYSICSHFPAVHLLPGIAQQEGYHQMQVPWHCTSNLPEPKNKFLFFINYMVLGTPLFSTKWTDIMYIVPQWYMAVIPATQEAEVGRL